MLSQGRKPLQVKTVMVTPDKHVPYHDRDAWNCMIKAIGIIKPDTYVDIGDFAESDSVSHWQWKKTERPSLKFQLETMHKEIEVINSYMDIVDEALKKAGTKEKIYIQGNHDKWWDSVVEGKPILSVANRPDGKGYGYDWHKIVRLKERGYEYFTYGQFCRIGKLFFLHGDLYSGKYHGNKYLENFEYNVIYGHMHSIQQQSVTLIDGTNSSNPRSAWCIGCLKSMKYADANQFTKGRPLNWGHGFAIVYFFENGLFTVNQVRIIDGQCVVHGEYIDGREKKIKKRKVRGRSRVAMV